MEQRFCIKELSAEQILTIYTGVAGKDFPQEELKPVEVIERLLEEEAYEGLGLFDGEALAAYALFTKVPGREVLLLDYYAVLEAWRNGGMGSFFLQQMKVFYRDRKAILLETEQPERAETQEDYALRVRRNAFYERNGAVRTRVESSLYGVAFGIFCIPLASGLDDREVYEQLDAIYRYIFTGENYGKYVWIERKNQE